jgi:hypothetical protein
VNRAMNEQENSWPVKQQRNVQRRTCAMELGQITELQREESFLRSQQLLSWSNQKVHYWGTRPRHQILPGASRIQTAPSHPISLRSISILSHHLWPGLPNWSPPSFLTKNIKIYCTCTSFWFLLAGRSKNRFDRFQMNIIYIRFKCARLSVRHTPLRRTQME